MCNLSGYVEEKGMEKGELGIMSLYQWLRDSGRNDEAEAVMIVENRELRKKLYEEMQNDIEVV